MNFLEFGGDVFKVKPLHWQFLDLDLLVAIHPCFFMVSFLLSLEHQYFVVSGTKSNSKPFFKIFL